MQKANSERLEHLEAELRKANKRNEKEGRKVAYKFAKKWNEEQYEFNQEIYHKIELAVEESDEEEHGQLLRESMRRINERNKILTVTDHYGWETALAYLTDPIASDEEDEKRLKKARKEAIAAKLEKQKLANGKSTRKDVPSATKRPFLGSSGRGGLPATTSMREAHCWRCGKLGHYYRTCHAVIPAQYSAGPRPPIQYGNIQP